MGIASLVLGIASILCSLLGSLGLSWGGIVLGAVGIVLGALARRNYGDGFATAGFVLSIVGTSLSVLFLLVVTILVAFVGNLIGSFF